MDLEHALAQARRYAEELRSVHGREQTQLRAVEDALAKLESSYRTTVRALAAALELRDDQTGDHAVRVTTLGLRVARRVAPELAAEPQLEYGFLLHDLGKIGVPDGILLKPGPLAESERVQVQEHPTLGGKILDGIPYLHGLARDVVVSHHERWDGDGYPDGLRGEEIPLPARIFAIVDTFDAMTHDRPYRRALSVESALAEIDRQAGRQFDPTLAQEFVTLWATLVAA